MRWEGGIAEIIGLNIVIGKNLVVHAKRFSSPLRPHLRVNKIKPQTQVSRSNPPSPHCRVLLMIASLDGGGSERQTLLLLKHLSRERFSLDLFLLRRGGSLYEQIPSDVTVHCFEDSAPRFRIGWPGRIHRAQVAAVRRVLVDRKIDVVYDRTFHMTLIAGPAAASARVPRVSTIVSPPSHAVPQNAGRFLAIKKRQLADAYAKAAQVIAVSGPAAADARRFYGLKPKQVIAIPNPVDVAAIDAAVASCQSPARDGRYTIVCVGRMTQEKGHECLIKAIACLRERYPNFPRPRVWLVGDGPLRHELEAKTKTLGLLDAIEFIGHVSNPAPWIAAADALCLPSTFEGFPNVMLEAMALGTPVIASDIDVVRSLGRVAHGSEDRGRDYVAIYRNQDPAELARKIRRLRINPTATLSRINAARNLARRALAIEMIVPRIEATILGAK